jgi:hypothetical protein
MLGMIVIGMLLAYKSEAPLLSKVVDELCGQLVRYSEGVSMFPTPAAQNQVDLEIQYGARFPRS